MKTLRACAFGLLVIACSPGTLPAFPGGDAVRITKGPGVLIAQTSTMSREVKFSEEKPSPVYPASYNVAGKGELLDARTLANWFELPVNGVRITNRDPYWVFDGYTTHKLKNGGTELRIRFRGAGAPAATLEWEFVLQVFPGSTVCREKIVFRTRPGSNTKLGVSDGKALFVFPGYRFSAGREARPTARTIKLAAWGFELIPADRAASFDERSMETGTRIGRNLAQNYMYHPVWSSEQIGASWDSAGPGPVFLLEGLPQKTGILLAYEHGAPDGDPDQEYLLIRRKAAPSGVDVRVEYARGAYCKDQPVTEQDAFESVWSVLGCFDTSDPAGGTSLLHGYLSRQITEADLSREPFFYYNTWGMQRDEERRGADVRSVLTVERVIREVDLAARLNVDLFVLDDGWQDRFGDWNPDPRRFADGLQWYVRAARNRNMIPGLWFATLATDSDAVITRSHPEWLVREGNGLPVVGRWGRNVFCFDSDYREYFIQKCKERIDEGIRYFKWDGLDKQPCASPRHRHGTPANSPEERKSKAGYDIPLLAADAIRQLREYNPEVVVEVDVTEPYRSVGLAILSEGRYFWMNNGASAYGDYSSHRARSMRFIPNLYHTILPLSLQAYANYPHNIPPYSAWRGNVNSSLIGGWGFWGNLTLIDSADIARTGRLVALSKRVLRDVSSLRPRVTGGVGASPEIYELVDREKAVGQVVAFSGSALRHDYVLPGVRQKKLLAVLRNAYSVEKDTLALPFTFPMAESSREAFLLPNAGAGISITSSTSWIEDVRLIGSDTLTFIPGAPGRHVIEWDGRIGRPVVAQSDGTTQTVTKSPGGGPFIVTITSTKPGMEVRIAAQR